MSSEKVFCCFMLHFCILSLTRYDRNMRKFIVLSTILFGMLIVLVAMISFVASPSGRIFFANIIENTPWARNTAAIPSLTAQAYLVADIDTGEVFAELSGTKEFPIASLTKLMTAIISEEVFSPAMNVPITESAVREPGNSSGLRAGTKIQAKDLLYPLLMESSNDAAKAFALFYGQNDFVQRMNLNARRLGMTKTRFTDTSGLNSGNTSTARDLFIFTQHLANEKPHLLQITKTHQHSIRAIPYTHELRNSNIFTKDAQFIGGKIGETTAAKETMLSVFSIPQWRKERRIAIIVLRSDDREGDTAKLLEWAKRVR